MGSFSSLVDELLGELKHGRVTKPGDDKYYNIKKANVQSPRNGVGIERDQEGKLRAAIVTKKVAGHKVVRRLPARFDDRSKAQGFAQQTAREMGISYYGTIPATKD